MNISKLLTTIFLLVTSVVSFAQVQVTGTVVDDQNVPIIGATVLLKSTTNNFGKLTDDSGQFEIEAPEGSYTIEIRYLGFKPYKNTIEVSSSGFDVGTIELKEGDEQLQNVEVIGRARTDYNSDYSFSATKIAIKNKELPQAVATVTKELIDDRLAFQLPDAVKTVSSVALTGLYNHYNIRGITQADDGQVVNGMRTRQYYFLQPITSHLERVEVIKGPSSVTFSSADPGGTVNMVTKKPLTEKRSEVSLTTGSFGTLRATGDFTGPLNESKTLLYRFNAAFQEADSFRDVVNNNAILIAPSFSYIPNNNTSLNVEMVYSNAEGNLDRGQPIFDTGANYDINSTPITRNVGASSDHYKNKELMLMASFNKKFTENFGFTAQYMKQTWDEDLAEHRVETNAVDIDGNDVPSLIRLRYDERQQFWETDNFSGYFNYDIKKGNITNKLLVGYDATRWERKTGAGFLRARRYSRLDGGQSNFNPDNAADFQQIVVDGVTFPAPSAAFFDLNNPFNGARDTRNYNIAELSIPANLNTSNGIYIQNQFKVGKFSALVNLRYEWFTDIFDYKSSNEEEFDTSAFVPRLGLTYEVTNEISAYATYLGGFQPHTNTVSLSPTAEGFFWAASPARFDPLESSLVEVGAKAEFLNGKVFANLAVFRVTQKNILLGDTYDLDNLTTRGEQQSTGFEADISGYISPNFQVTASYGYNDATIEEDAIQEFIGERIGGAPENSANFWTRYDFNASSALKGVGVGLGVQYVDERFTWYNPTYDTNRVLLPSYTVMEGAIYYKPTFTNMQLTLKVNNLLNETYWLGGLNPSRLGPGAPRNVLLNATYKF